MRFTRNLIAPKSLIAPTVVAVVVLVIALAVAPSGAPVAATGPGHSSTGHSSSGTTLAGRHVAVRIYMFAFEPASFTVKVGTTITFTNRDQTAHTATANDGAFDTGTIAPGQSRSITVRKAGVFPYHCVFHAFMTGTLTVTS